MLIPVEYKVLVKPKQIKDKTDGGIALPVEVRERDQLAVTEGEILAIADSAFEYYEDNARKPQVGDKVIMAKYAGQVHEEDGVQYRLVNDKDIVAIEEKNDE